MRASISHECWEELVSNNRRPCVLSVRVKYRGFQRVYGVDLGRGKDDDGGSDEGTKGLLEKAVFQDKRCGKFVKRVKGACLTIGKLVMFIQIGFLTFCLASNAVWNTVIPPLKTLLKSAESIVEHHRTPEQEFACFIDYPLQDVDMYGGGDNADECEGRWKQCPHHGRCYKGKLRDCSDGLYNGMTLFVMNERGDECVGSPEAKELTKLVQDALVKMTTDQVCRGGLPNEEDGSFPLFSMYMVAANVKDPSDEENVGLQPDALLWLEPVFDPKMVRYGSLSGDDLNAIGLGEGVPPNSLPLPTGVT